jgi:hypothetical protein
MGRHLSVMPQVTPLGNYNKKKGRFSHLLHPSQPFPSLFHSFSGKKCHADIICIDHGEPNTFVSSSCCFHNFTLRQIQMQCALGGHSRCLCNIPGWSPAALQTLHPAQEARRLGGHLLRWRWQSLRRSSLQCTCC